MATAGKVKVLILGANGMLGHKLYQVLSKDLDMYGTVRCGDDKLKRFGGTLHGLYNFSKMERNVECADLITIGELLNLIQPTVIINCIGIIDKHYAEQNRQTTTWINAIFPHLLYQICPIASARLIHISTDCVFSGREGNYTEASLSDATDVYGKTKYLGEVTSDNVLTIRTSLIGRELVRSRGLLEWLISNKGGTVNGYTNAIFSGFPTVTFAGIIKDIILNYPELNGLYHIVARPIDKYMLLNMINDTMHLGVGIIKESEYRCDRSLDATKFNKATGFKPLTWQYMLNDMAEDARQYEAWR